MQNGKRLGKSRPHGSPLRPPGGRYRLELKSGTGLTKLEPRRKPVKYGAGGGRRGNGKRR